MSKPALFSSRWAVLGRLAVALFLVLASAGVGYGAKPEVTPAPPSPGESEIVFNGKLFCSLKRQIDLPFKGIITSLKAHSGQQVAAGDILATYRLAPAARQAIQQRLSPPQLAEVTVKLAELERTLVPLLSHQRELTQLAEKDLAPSQSLAQVNRQVKLLQQEKAALRGRYKEDRQLARQDREVLSHLLGTTLKSDQVPWEVALKAPISGHVIWVNPKVRVGAELPPLPDTFQVGVMDPMVVRAHVFEIEALQLKVGESAELTLDSLPGRVFHAQVSRISWTPVTTGLEQPTYYEVELKVSNPDLALKEGLKAKVVLHKSK